MFCRPSPGHKPPSSVISVRAQTVRRCWQDHGVAERKSVTFEGISSDPTPFGSIPLVDRKTWECPAQVLTSCASADSVGLQRCKPPTCMAWRGFTLARRSPARSCACSRCPSRFLVPTECSTLECQNFVIHDDDPPARNGYVMCFPIGTAPAPRSIRHVVTP
jgi:hypothetical protein